MRFLKYIIFLSAAMAGTVLLSRCEKPAAEPAVVPVLEAALSADSYFLWNAGGAFLTITATEAWTLSIAHPEGVPGGWCSANVAAGTGKKNVWLAFTANTSGESRTATVTVASEHYVRTVVLTQRAQGEVPPTPLDLSPYLELPKVQDRDWLFQYIAGDFFLEYAPDKKHPKWVAWPLHNGHLGGSGRTDYWQWDPRIPAEYHPTRGDFTSTLYNNRGHICPSADRTLSVEMNRQTFMYSNMSPQMGDFNGGIWGQLETKVRTWVGGLDTLYICAGGTIRNESEIIMYTTPSSMPVPAYYFKVILRRRAATGTYDAIGFWFEHRKYTDTEPLSAAHAKTIDQIEALTGFDFFYSLREDIQDVVEETFNPGAWGL
ncbi:MAG: DNA/RNA non-specific endonuclease [Prevotellaceae bacterium]|jgi:endonuclease G|nr:DNA/RNA non-specific endonuclease [Prevotellaceae bacterium]